MMFTVAAAADCTPPNCRPAATDPFSPNCKGQNYSCLTTQTQQHAFGQAPANAATFNDFGMPNVGFCKMQQKLSPGRSHTNGPQLMQTGRVFGGVGLSQAQFGIGADSPKSQAGDGGVSCGMCLEVTAKMALWDCELTKPVNLHNQSLWPEQKLIVMVMDQCKDEWTEWSADGTTAAGNCNTGHLDFDVYPTDHSVSFLGVKNLTWRAVDCPVGELPIQIAFSTANEHMNKYSFAVHLWDLKVPVTGVSVQVVCRNGTLAWQKMTYFALGWQYQAQQLPGCFDTVYDWPANITLRLTSAYGEALEESLGVPANLTMGEDFVALPTVPTKRQFSVAHNPPSADANAHYKQCVGPAPAPAPPGPKPGPTPPKPPVPPTPPGPCKNVPFGQCAGGHDPHNPYHGYTCCPAGYTCKAQSSYYSQCCPNNRPCTPGSTTEEPRSFWRRIVEAVA